MLIRSKESQQFTGNNAHKRFKDEAAESTGKSLQTRHS
jgi:hypothetical protein